MLNLIPLLSIAIAAPAAGPVLHAATQPSIAPLTWQLNFRYQDPQRVSVMLPGQKTPAVYWCMLYTVDNPSDEDVEFLPSFELVTDTLQVVPSEVRVSPEAFRAIQRRSGDPLLVTPDRAVGPLLRGEDRARHSVAIWRNIDPKAREFKVYVSGLSGEMSRVKNPTFNAEKPEGPDNRRFFTLRRTLEITYKLPGGDSARASAVPERQTGDPKWIMR